MALMDTVETMKRMLNEMQTELEDVIRGNKAAAKRVRKATLNFAKVAKMFRKESVEAGKTKT
jgi:histone H1-like protein Hc1